MNILDTIIAHKKIEVVERKKIISESELKNTINFNKTCFSLISSLSKETTTGIIAEFKRKSPSKGFINEFADVTEITKGYASLGAAGLSVLTDNTFFGGSTKDLIAASANKIPILRKDFIIDKYQIAEAKSMGADVILLIAACLSKNDVKLLASYAVSLGLEVLLELHNETELNHICDDTILIGVNNRNLKDFTVDINASIEMSKLIPNSKIKIAESGINSTEILKTFKNAGFKGFLIGENFMKESNTVLAFDNFVKNI
ncbi:MAG: indole-3-glycerol phosphate synthase TrpC [Ferruginibacter sp.]|nr:indole-3-glycerol phosphate synthase TrpC [Ferruginibacter sp.]